MSESTITQPDDPKPNPDPNSTDQTDPVADPLLDSGAFIAADTEDTEPPPSTPPQQDDDPNPDVEIGPGVGIAAEPISAVPMAEGGGAEETPKNSTPIRRNMEEMSKRPSWLPDGWTLDLRQRSSGVSAGTIDRYYRDPTGRKFRSKNEVFQFLETGIKPKRKQSSEAETGSSESSASKKPKKSNSKGKKAEPLNFDFTQPPEMVSWVHSGQSGTWSAHARDQPIPEKQQKEWSAAFTYVTQDLKS